MTPFSLDDMQAAERAVAKFETARRIYAVPLASSPVDRNFRDERMRLESASVDAAKLLPAALAEIRRLREALYEAHQKDSANPMIETDERGFGARCACPDCAAWRSSVEVQREQG